MKPIKDLATEHKTQKALAIALGVSPAQINRWIKLEALVSVHTGEVWVKSHAKVNPLI